MSAKTSAVKQESIRRYPQLPLVRLIGLIVIWRTIGYALIFIAISRIHQIANPDVNSSVNAFYPLQGTMKWDGFHYLTIVTQGYGAAKSGLEVFYPLYPLSVHAVAAIGIGPIPAAAAVNTLASIAAGYFLYELGRDYLKSHTGAIQAVLLFLFFPMAGFLFAFYTEALFCALTFGAFYFARKRVWWAAGIMLALVTATRLPGLLVVAAVAIEYASSRDWNWRKLDRNGAWLLLAPIGIVGYALYLNAHFGDPLLFIHGYRYGWAYQVFNLNIFATIWHQITSLGHLLSHHSGEWQEPFIGLGLELIAWMGALILIVLNIRKIPASYSFFVLASLVLFSLNSNLTSVPRYLLPLFPIYLIAARYFQRRPTQFGLVLGCSAALFGLYLVLFANGYWVG